MSRATKTHLAAKNSIVGEATPLASTCTRSQQKDFMANNDSKARFRPKSGGALAFTLGCLPLTVAGLVLELVAGPEMSLPNQLILTAGWLITGSIAAIGFFILSSRSEDKGPSRIGEVCFCLMGISALSTSTALYLIALASSPESSTLSGELNTGVWVLAILGMMAGVTLPTSLGRLMLLFIPGVAIWCLGAGYAIQTRVDLTPEGFALQLVICFAPMLTIGIIRMKLNSNRDERDILQSRLEAFGGELARARQIHDSMFPQPIHGEVELEYTYDPLLGIGGDFLHVYSDERTGQIALTILDVSGHGLAAALTVNRLFGELERICAENPDHVTPSLLMSGLNRYVNLVMSDHSLYATAACLLLDPRKKTLNWSVAGHPPPLLRRQNSTVEDLECTSVILGALKPELFDPDEQSTSFQHGDVVLVYTDGAFESRNSHGEFFGIKRLRETMAFDTPPRDWSRFVVSAVEQFRGKHTGESQNIEDDLLVASLSLGSRQRVIKEASSS